MSSEEDKVLSSINLKTLMLVFGVVGIIASSAGQWFVLLERQRQFEKALIEQKKEMAIVKDLLRKPRYTLEDDERRMAAERLIDQREMDRRARWMDEQNKFRLQMVEFAAETRHATAEMRRLVQELKENETD